MLKGRVNRQGEPLVPISLILRTQPTQYLGVIDTGFNGYLSVPKWLVRRSRWQAIGTERFEIATGALVEQEIYLGDIVFDGLRGPMYALRELAGSQALIIDAQKKLAGLPGFGTNGA